jgi:hypothetical protein
VSSVCQFTRFFINFEGVDSVGVLACDEQEVSFWGDAEGSWDTSDDVFMANKSEQARGLVDAEDHDGLMSSVTGIQELAIG